MQRDLILAYDIGTSGIKTTLVNDEGKILASDQYSYPSLHPFPGSTEQDPNDWWKGACATTNSIMKDHPEFARRVSVIGISGHMLGCVPVDEDGNPVHAALLHSDARAQKQAEQIREMIGREELYQMSGNILDSRASLCKMLWFKEERPDLYAKTARFLQSKDYLLFKLTDNMDSTDYSDAAHGVLMDIRKKTYRPGLYADLGLDMKKLPQLHAGMEIVGRTTNKSAAALGLMEGIPVIAGGGDGACSDIGAGNVHTRDIYCSLGTTAWLSKCISEPYLDPGMRTFTIMGLDGEHCSMFGTTQSACGALNFVLDILGITDLKECNRLAGEISPGSDGLIFLPYLDGERSPVFDTRSRGAFFGLSLSHTRGHFLRATFEGVAYALNSILEVFREEGDLDEIKIIGGGSNSELWKQILSDVLQVKVASLNASAEDSTSLGVAAAAGTAVGIFPSLSEATKSIRISEVTNPSPDREIYKKYYAIYKKLYPDLKEEMHAL